jgi:hypothetical protein
MSTLSTAICISVIDEVSPANNLIDSDWLDFRTNYPNRTIWVLDPEFGGEGVVSQQIYTPASYQADPLANGPVSVRRDNGVTANRSDWFTICGLNTKPAGTVISLAVDTSGSMTLSTVRASYDWFKEKAAAANFTLIEDTTFPNERWIPPHNKVLPPSAFITVVPDQIVQGASATLSWQTAPEATSSTITPIPGAVTAGGSLVVSPNATTQYSLTTVTANFTVTISTTLFVRQPATVVFTADSDTITAGSCTTLRWNTGGDALSASINQGIGAVNINGTRLVCPSQTTTYIISVSDYGLGTTASVTVNVNTAIPLNSPNPLPVFNTLSNLPLSTPAYSNVVIIQGLTSPANVTAGFGTLVAVRNTNATTTNAAGYSVLTGATFASSATISNGQYLQLLGTSPSNPNTTLTINVNIGDGESLWTISTGVAVSTTPVNFTFPDVFDVAPNTQIVSLARPIGGISGLGAGITVPVELVSTTGTTPRIKINNGSFGVFPASVANGDTITLSNISSSVLGGNVETLIKVGSRVLTAWSIDTYTSPDSAPSFSAPPNLSNRPPNTFITSAVIGITDFNIPITITATNGALISIDYDTPVAGPRTFTPSNQLIYLVLQTPNALSSTATTTVTIGDSPPFTWSISTYATVPPAQSNLSTWYSIKTIKYDGFSIGTVVQVLKEDVVNGYGDLQQRFPGFLECDGSSYLASQYPDLWNVIQNTYGGDGSYNISTKAYSGSFNVPDYRNKRICGVGVIDANQGGSAFLPVSSGSINAVGSTGGYWYIDRTGIAGPLPLEQVFTGGTESNFFSLGTVKTIGTENLTAEFNFNVTGAINAFIQEVGETTVNVPSHDHTFFSSTTEDDGAEPLIPWAQRALYGLGAGATGTLNRGRITTPGEQAENIDMFRTLLGSTFISEVEKTGVDFDSIVPYDSSETIAFGNWWASPLSQLVNAATTVNSNRIYDVGGAAANDAGVIDTKLSSMRLNPYSSPGVLKSHSHLMSLDVPSQPTTDFTFGNLNGPGNKYAGSLPTANQTVELTFNQSELLLELSPATFNFSSSVKPIPTVELSPTKVVPLATPFHKVKYIIKAY